MGTPSSQPALHDRYASFIQGLELQNIWLTEASIENHVGPGTPLPVDVDIESRATYRQEEQGDHHELIAFQDFRLTYRHEEAELGVLRVGFGLSYTLNVPIDADLWQVFRERNLPVNAWPFLREYVSNTLGRMGWTPYLLPALKVGVPWEEQDDSAKDRPEVIEAEPEEC